MGKAFKIALGLSLLAGAALAQTTDWSIAKHDPSAGGGYMPPITSFPGQGAGSSGSPAGTAVGTTAGAAATDYAKEQTGQKCRQVLMPGGTIPEC